MTIKQMITKLKTISELYGDDMEVEVNIEHDATYQTHSTSFSIALDSLRDDKQGNKLVIKLD